MGHGHKHEPNGFNEEVSMKSVVVSKEWGLLIGFVGAVVLLNASPSLAMGRRPTVISSDTGSSLKTSVAITGVSVTRENSLAGNWDRSMSCEVFRGTHPGNTVYIDAVGEGGHSRYTHTLVYTLNNSYQLNGGTPGQVTKSIRGNGTFAVTLPALREDVPYVNQTFFLVTQDGSGKSVTASATFLVARPVILQISQKAESREKDCFQRYTAYEGPVGLLSNGSTNSSTIEVKQGLQKIWSSTRQKGWGVWFSPLAPLGLGSLVSLHYDYFAETTKQTIETIDVASNYSLNPGDFMQLYVQPTRFVTAYDATLVNPCGETQSLDGAYLFQWWGFSYHLYPVSILDSKRPPIEAVGAPPVNTCPAELNSMISDGPNGAYEFRNTNF